MLFKNHEKVSLKTEPIYKKYKDEFESFLKGKDTVTIKTKDLVKINVTGYKEPDRFHSVPVQAVVENADGSGEDYWIYTETAPRKKQNGEWEYTFKPFVIQREITLPTKEWEKIFFLMYLSTAAKNKRILVVDEAKEEEQKVTRLKETSRINFLIMDDMSPVDEFTIRRIAKAFGVGNVDNKNTDKVKLELKAVIDIADATHDNFRDSKAFVKAINEGEEYDTRAQVQEAIDANRIKYNEIGCYWYYAGEDGSEIKKIMNVDLLIANDKIRRINALNNYYIVNADKRVELARLLNYSIEDIDFSNYEFVSLRQFAARSGIDSKGKAEELIPRIQKYYEENKNTKHFDFSILVVSEKKQLSD